MKYHSLGNTGLSVSEICFGGLTIGPLQANLSLEMGAAVISRAFDKGINFIDTAQLYKTYPYIREALKNRRREDIVICSKSYAYDRATAESSLQESLDELDTDYIDLFLLHEQESIHTVRGHMEALEYYHEMKSKGIIRAVGLSTHRVAGVLAAIRYRELIDVVHPLLNIKGIGIQDGTAEDMLAMIRDYRTTGGGVFSMKPFGGGHLLEHREACYEFVQNLLADGTIDSVAMGMQSLDEVDANCAQFEGMKIDSDLNLRLNCKKRRLIIDDWCGGCGACVEKCGSKALTLVDGKAVVNPDKCVTCGYCGAVCPDFCIKII